MVLAGRRVRASTGGRKVTALLWAGDGDVVIEPAAIVRQGPGGRRRETYPVAAAPYALGSLMDRAHVAALTEPTVSAVSAGLDADFLGASPTGRLACVWLRATDAGPIEVRLRSDREPPLHPLPIPAEGPLAWPADLPAWDAMRFRDFDPPIACPHCGVASSRCRDLGDALVCKPCGRSFTPPPR